MSNNNNGKISLILFCHLKGSTFSKTKGKEVDEEDEDTDLVCDFAFRLHFHPVNNGILLSEVDSSV